MTAPTAPLAAPPAVPLSLGRAARLERRDPGESAAYLTVDGHEASATLGFSERQLMALAFGYPARGPKGLLAAVAYLTGGGWEAGDWRALGALARAALRGRER
jgi:hypothetical protein